MNVYKLVIVVAMSLFLFSCSNAKFQSGQKVFVNFSDDSTVWPSIPGYAVGNVIEEKDKMILVQVSKVHKKDSLSVDNLSEGKTTYISIDKLVDYEVGKKLYDDELFVKTKAFFYFRAVIEEKIKELPDEETATNLIEQAKTFKITYLIPIFKSTSLLKIALMEKSNRAYKDLYEESSLLVKLNMRISKYFFLTNFLK